MKKAIYKILSLSLFVSSAMPVLACSNSYLDNGDIRFTVVTDGHTINDHSFNEASYLGAQAFKSEFDKWSSKPIVSSPKSSEEAANLAMYHGHKSAILWDNPVNTNLSDLRNSYSKAVFMDSKVIIASGFLHYNALVQAQTKYLVNKVKFAFVDGDTFNDVPPAQRELNAIVYKAEQSGFLAGLAGALWLEANALKPNPLYDKDHLKVSTYGGVDLSGVTNYMYGFYWAIKYLDSHLTDDPGLIGMVNDIIGQKDAISELKNIDFIKLNNQFSGDFNQGSTNSKSINSALATQNKTDVIFTVAGPQADDTLAALKSAGLGGKIIGVDTDQQSQYSYAPGMFITSALKQISTSVKIALWNAIGRSADGEHAFDPNIARLKYAPTTPPEPLGGKDYTGIATSSLIDKIYDPANNVNTIYDYVEGTRTFENTNLLEAVSSGWKKVLIAGTGKGYWDLSIDDSNNPFN